MERAPPEPVDEARSFLITRRETKNFVTNRIVNQIPEMTRRFDHTKRHSGLVGKAEMQFQAAIARVKKMAYLRLAQYPEQGTHCNLFCLE
jgi:hypothetical protein